MENNILSIKKFNSNSLDFKNYKPLDGEIAEFEDGYKIYNNEKWSDIKIDNTGLKLNLYDLNKQIVGQLEDMKDYNDSINKINNLNTKFNNRFYMLYGKEISYFTLFMGIDYNDVPNLGVNVIECLKEIGIIKSIDNTKNKDAIEIWIKENTNNEITCLYLFPYDTGIVEFRG